MSKSAKAVATSPDERRSSPRLELELEVEVGLDSDHNFYTGLTQDISTGGLFVATHQLRRVGEHVQVKFTLPGRKEPIVAETEVRWVRENMSRQDDSVHGMGLKFLSLDEGDVKAIAEFVSRRESLFFDDE